MHHAIDRHFENTAIALDGYQTNLVQIEKDIIELEDRFYIGRNIPEATYQRLHDKLTTERGAVLKEVAGLNTDSSNLREGFRKAIELSMKLSTAWASGPVSQKEKIQKAIFPEGIFYNREKGAFRTEKVNELFQPIPILNSIPEDDQNKQGSISAALSNWVELSIGSSNRFMADLDKMVEFFSAL